MSSTESIFIFDRQKLHSKLLFFWRIFPEASNHATCIACPKLHLFREIRSFSPWCLKFTSRVYSTAGYADGEWEVWKWWMMNTYNHSTTTISSLKCGTSYSIHRRVLPADITLFPSNPHTDKPKMANKSKLLSVAHSQTTSLCTWK